LCVKINITNDIT